MDGRNRYHACLDVKVDPKFKNWDGKGSLIDFIISRNLHRRHLNESQKATCALAALPFLREEAKARQRLHGGTAPGKNGKLINKNIECPDCHCVSDNWLPADETPDKRKFIQCSKCGYVGLEKTLSEKIHEVISPNGRATEYAAKMFGTNSHYVSDADKIANENPEYFEKIKSGELTIPKAKKQIKREQVFAQAEQIKNEPVFLPKGPFRVIVIDPPWEYNTRAEDISHRAANRYCYGKRAVVQIYYESSSMSWTREILVAKHGDGLSRRPSETTKHRARAAARPASVAADFSEVDSLDCIDFGSRLMSISELARVSGVGQKLLRQLVRSGKLRALHVPGAERLRYSPQELAEIIREHNGFCLK